MSTTLVALAVGACLSCGGGLPNHESRSTGGPKSLPESRFDPPTAGWGTILRPDLVNRHLEHMRSMLDLELRELAKQPKATILLKGVVKRLMELRGRMLDLEAGVSRARFRMMSPEMRERLDRYLQMRRAGETPRPGPELEVCVEALERKGPLTAAVDRANLDSKSGSGRLTSHSTSAM